MLAAPRSDPLPFDRHAPFGAGDAARRIVDVLESSLADGDCDGDEEAENEVVAA
jgi:hypothetical protein